MPFSLSLLFLIPLPWATFSILHLSTTLNKISLFFLCWVSELNQLTQIRISRSEPHKSELAGMSPFFFVNSELPCDTQKH